MLDEAWATQGELDEVHAAIAREVDDAVAWAEQSPFPDAATLLDDVYESQ
jgi:pyruvate dehydrogenase E1 component alpha subunit